jgi:3-hydroxyisobutyrate dehydrogenase-like beta-hydroxyacid dehydrogenase
MTGRRITVIGLGAMGAGMAHALLGAGFELTVHNRTAAKAAPLVARGAVAAESVAEAVRGADTVLASLADEAAVSQVLLGQALPELAAGAVVIDASTVSPTFSRRAGQLLAEHGVHRLEACAIGNPAMARAGQLRWLTGGDQAVLHRVVPVLEACGQEHRHLGPAGSASTLKLALNLLLGVQTAGLAEAVGLVEAAGVDRQALLDTVERSGWRSPVLSFRAEFMRRRNYEPAGFRSALMRKDLELALREAAGGGAELPVTRCVAGRYAAVAAGGHGDEDAAVLAEAFLAVGSGR